MLASAPNSLQTYFCREGEGGRACLTTSLICFSSIPYFFSFSTLLLHQINQNPLLRLVRNSIQKKKKNILCLLKHSLEVGLASAMAPSGNSRCPSSAQCPSISQLCSFAIASIFRFLPPYQATPGTTRLTSSYKEQYQWKKSSSFPMIPA